jgi:hypothetical protein
MRARARACDCSRTGTRERNRNWKAVSRVAEFSAHEYRPRSFDALDTPAAAGHAGGSHIGAWEQPSGAAAGPSPEASWLASCDVRAVGDHGQPHGGHARWGHRPRRAVFSRAQSPGRRHASSGHERAAGAARPGKLVSGLRSKQPACPLGPASCPQPELEPALSPGLKGDLEAASELADGGGDSAAGGYTLPDCDWQHPA